MSEVIGNMTEVARIDAGKLKVVVSYWTSDKGERYEPRLRFLVGERERPSKGLTRTECLAVRDAFNQLCIEWAAAEDNVVRMVSADKPKPKAKPGPAVKSPADAIAELMAKAVASTK